MYAGYIGREARPSCRPRLPRSSIFAPRARSDRGGGPASKLKAHLAKRGYGDIEVNVTGGYDPTLTDENSSAHQASTAV